MFNIFLNFFNSQVSTVFVNSNIYILYLLTDLYFLGLKENHKTNRHGFSEILIYAFLSSVYTFLIFLCCRPYSSKYEFVAWFRS